MDQTSNVAMSMLQTIASQAAQLPKTGGKTDDELGDFQKLLEEKSQEKDPLMEQPAKTPAKTQTAPAKKPEKTTVQQKENPVERAKKLAEQGAWFTQPSVGFVDMDLETGEVLATYEPGEYILAHIGGQTEVIPVAGLETWERLQLQQVMDGAVQTIDVSDPEADALLEATAPGADNSPAAMLERLVDGQTGNEIQPVVKEVQPQQEEDDIQVELLDVEQAPQPLFRDVEAAPVKVGEVYDAQQTEAPDVAQQINAGVVQAMERGESLVRVQLNPEHLGQVTVEIRQSVDGILHVALNAHNTETRGLLERHAGELQGLLSSRGSQEVQVEVQRQSESQQGQNQQHQNYDGRNGQPQDGQERRQQRRSHTSSQDFMQQLRLGLIPTDGEL